MVLPLPVDVANQRRRARRGHGEGPVAALPGEASRSSDGVFHPSRGRGLDPLDQPADGRGAAHPASQMHVVCRSADPDRDAPERSAASNDIGVKRVAHGVSDRVLAILCAEHDVDEQLRQGL